VELGGAVDPETGRSDEGEAIIGRFNLPRQLKSCDDNEMFHISAFLYEIELCWRPRG
jgi:hypothetical protein